MEGVMAAILERLQNTVIAGLVATVVLIVVLGLLISGVAFTEEWWKFLFRWLHVLSGIMWIGHLYYFNFTQMLSMPKIPDEQKPAISKHIAPMALFWFRWGAMATILTGLILAALEGYIHDAILIGLTDAGAHTPIGIGMWLGAIMWFNVWFVIWPNQQKALGLVDAGPDVKKQAARTAMLFSRTNTLLSIPMLYCMVAQQNGGFFSFVSGAGVAPAS
jgi:uncharacterized membrane protein